MTDIELQALLTDIVALQKRDGFGSQFVLSLVEKDKFDQLVVHIPWCLPPLKLHIQYAGYPATPQIRPRGDDSFAAAIAAQLQERVNFAETPVLLDDLISMIIATAGREQLPHLRAPITEVRFSDTIYNQILIDYTQYAPNEYAFICSGTHDKDGSIAITHYYPGEMRVSTPVYCELTAEFINQTVYDDIPHDHTIIVWGHVHPIESPSRTDTDSFDDLAAWDQETATIGAIKKRSIALLVSSVSRKATFHNVNTHDLIPHLLTPPTS